MTTPGRRRLCGVEITDQADGSISIARLEGPASAAFTGCGGCFITAVASFFLAASLGTLPWVHWTMLKGSTSIETSPIPWPIPALGLLWGLATLRDGFAGMFGKETWQVGPDLLVIQSSVFGIRQVKRWSGARLFLVPQAGLLIGKTLLKTRTLVSEGDWQELIDLGKLLAAHTGWSFEVRDPATQAQTSRD